MDDKLPCVVNTHGYVEADWVWGESSNPKMSKYRVHMQVGDAVELLNLLKDESAYQYHEIVIPA